MFGSAISAISASETDPCGRSETVGVFSECGDQETSTIKEAFAGVVGGLSSIVAQRVQLTLTCPARLKDPVAVEKGRGGPREDPRSTVQFAKQNQRGERGK